MKRFYVSDKCIACGECIIRTNQLAETPDGHAVPANNAYIDDAFLSEAKEIVDLCPVGALDIYEYESTTLSGTAGAEALADILEQRLKNVQIPEISSKDIAFQGKDYSVSYGYAEGEYEFRYSSESSARQAANRAFESTFWNHRSDYVLSLLTQYKSKVLRRYYDFEAKDNYFLGVIDQFQTILYDILCEAKSLTNGSITLSEKSFCTFSPDLSEVKKHTKEYIASFEANYLVKPLLDALSKETYHRLSDYESNLYIESRSEVIGQSWLGSNKLKWTYSFEGVNTEGKDLVSDIKSALEYSESYGVRYVDELAAEKINFGIYLFNTAVNAEIRKKINEYKAALRKSAQQEDSQYLEDFEPQPSIVQSMDAAGEAPQFEEAFGEIIGVHLTPCKNGYRRIDFELKHPVSLGAVQYQCVPAADYEQFREFELHEGAVLLLRKYRDDVLSVSKVANGTGRKLHIPEFCPCCGKKFSVRNKNLYCDNLECPDNIVFLFAQFFESMGLTGYSTAFSETLVKKLKCTNLMHVLRITEATLKFRGVKSEMILNFPAKLKEAISKHRDYEILGAMGLPGVGPAKAKILLEQLSDLPKVSSLSLRDVYKVYGPRLHAACVAAVGEEQADSLEGYLIGPLFACGWIEMAPLIQDVETDTLKK